MCLYEKTNAVKEIIYRPTYIVMNIISGFIDSSVIQFTL
jgi:hypothetical protein